MSTDAADDFDFTTPVEVRYNDLDTVGHVNNAVYVTYFEQGRVRFFQEEIDATLEEMEMVVVHLDIDYHRPITLDDEVTVGIDVEAIGDSSFHLAYEVRADGETAATGETVQAAYDREAGVSKPIPDGLRERLLAFDPATE